MIRGIFNGGATDGNFTIGKEYEIEEIIGEGITLFDDDDLKEHSIEWLRENRSPWFETKKQFTLK